MKILVTGSNGFVGKNLLVYLREREDCEIVEFDKDNKFEEIENQIDSIDFVFHLAGVNRPNSIDEFYQGNSDLTKSLINLLNQANKKIPFVYSSSIQADLDNDYGKSKKQAEDYIINNYENSIIYRFHNVFGKWCKPNYNSVVATFCYNIAHHIPIEINDPNKELELVYIDDICEEFIKLIDNKITIKNKEPNYIIKTIKISLQSLAELIQSFYDNTHSIYTPRTGDEFIKKLFATYISYVPLEEMVTSTKKNVDERGSFTELVRTVDSGQFSVSFSKPGIVRGNHYHNTKMERFIVIKGTAKISFKKVDSDEKIEFIVNDEEIKVVTIPVGYTHNIENIGTDDMILFIWCNELFDLNHPDTYFMKVN